MAVFRQEQTGALDFHVCDAHDVRQEMMDAAWLAAVSTGDAWYEFLRRLTNGTGSRIAQAQGAGELDREMLKLFNNRCRVVLDSSS